MIISRRKLLGSLAIALGVASVPFTSALTASERLDTKWRVGDYFLAHNDKSIYKLTNIGTPPIYAGNDKAIYWLSIDPFHRLGSMVCPSHIFLTEEQMQNGYMGICPYPFKVGDRVLHTTQWNKNSDRFHHSGTINWIEDEFGWISMTYDNIWNTTDGKFVGVQMRMEEGLTSFTKVGV
jgi:hypothetical protein